MSELIRQRSRCAGRIWHRKDCLPRNRAGTVEGVGHFEPLRHYAEVHLLLEPGEPGSGLVPAMRRKLIEAIDCSRDNDVAYLILKFFDEYAKEVRRHMEYENEAVFTYVEQLLQGRLSDEYNIATFASKHNQIDTKLKELKNIIIKYYPEKENNNLLNAVLFDIFNCEQDLASHCQVEDYMFVPAVAQIEKRLKDEQ